jgi:uncharacterized protein (TIGR02300 family)
LGNKFVCFKCSTKFYDLKKPDPLCPKCGADQRESPATKPASEPKRARLTTAKVLEPQPEEAESEEEEADVESGEADDEDVELPEDEG